MRFLQSVTIVLALSVTAAVVAADFDGSVPLNLHGAWTVSIADSKGAYVAFGQCKVADAQK